MPKRWWATAALAVGLIVPAALAVPAADKHGRTAVHPSEPALEAGAQRLATHYFLAFEILAALGVQDRLVGVHGGLRKDPFVRRFFPRVAGLPDIGHAGGANLESLAALRPDLLLHRRRSGGETSRRLVDLGIQGLPLDIEGFEPLCRALEEVGRAVGRGPRGERLASEIRRRVQEVREVTGPIPLAQRPRVYMAGSRGLLSCPSAAMFQAELIRLAGGRPLVPEESGGWRTISPEQLLAWDPDMILLLRYGRVVDPAEVAADARWSSLRAVRDGRILRFPSNLLSWDRPTPAGLLGLLWLARELHPDRFPGLDLPGEVEAWHREILGLPFAGSGGEL